MEDAGLVVSLLAVVPGNVAVFTADLRLLYLNEALTILTGLSPEEGVGRPVTEVLPDLAPALVPLLHCVLHGGPPIRDREIAGEVPGLPGRPRTFLVSCEPVRGTPTPDGDKRRPGVVVRLEDITAESPPDAAPEGGGRPRSMREDIRGLVLETAHRIATDILTRQTGWDALQHIVEVARVLSGARYAALGVANPEGGGLLEFIASGMSPQEEAAIGSRPEGRGILGLLLTRKDPLRIADMGQHPASVGFPPNHPPMRGFLGVPIRQGDTVLGSLYLTEKEGGGGAFTEADVVAVEALGAHAAIAIYNLHMLRRQRALLSGLIHAQEAERRAVAYELHDGLTQYVTASHIHFELSQAAREAGDTRRATEQFQRGSELLKAAVVESRRLLDGLRTLALDDLGLVGALEQLLGEEKARAEWAVAELEQNLGNRRFDSVLETTVFRVVQEALTNARKHARTRAVHVSLFSDENPPSGAPLLTVIVRDAGVGFDADAQLNRYGHLGLQSMAERVQLLGGAFELQSAPGAGTVMRAVFPVSEGAATGGLA